MSIDEVGDASDANEISEISEVDEACRSSIHWERMIKDACRSRLTTRKVQRMPMESHDNA